MGFFGKIMEKLGFDAGASKVEEMLNAPVPPKAPATGTMGGPPGAPAVTPMKEVDVVALLEAKAAANPQKLNWRTSIVDLMKLLDIDSSLQSRKELATELGYSGAKDGSAEMNMWLHKAVLSRVAANGGNVPKELLD